MSKKYKTTLSIGLVADITGATQREIRYWETKGLISPDGSHDGKQWKIRRYDLRDILCIKVVKKLRGYGIPLQKIVSAISAERDAGVENPLSQYRFACLSRELVIHTSNVSYEPITGQQVFSEVLRDVKENIWSHEYNEASVLIDEANDNFLQMVVSR